MPRSQSYPIPLHDIPKGIQLCYENCKRLFDDAVLLEEQKRVSSSITNVILSQEEFAKALILFRYYQSNTGISKRQSEKIFSSHLLRLGKFSDYFFGIDSKLSKEDIAKFRLSSLIGKKTKEQHMYVDWSEKGWISPESSVKPIEVGGRDINWIMQIAFLGKSIETLDKDEDFQKVLNLNS